MMIDPRMMTRRRFGHGLGALMMGTALTACAGAPPEDEVEEGTLTIVSDVPHLPGYGPIFDSGYTLPAIPEQYTQGVNRRMEGEYVGEQSPGMIDVDPYAKLLYYIPESGVENTIRYPVGVGRAGLAFSGNGTIDLKRKWPGWTPTANMLRREPEVYGPFRQGIPGGLRSPLGSRALYLFRNGRDTFFRIHGTNDLTSIGNSGSAGCIRMFNQDIIDLYDRVPLGTRVHVRSEAESLRIDPEYHGRGIELPPVILDPDAVYGEAAVAADRPPDFDAVDPTLPIDEPPSEI
jgi:lipoprotein-anchoring transpeptidase ErfK/SrfK